MTSVSPISSWIRSNWTSPRCVHSIALRFGQTSYSRPVDLGTYMQVEPSNSCSPAQTHFAVLERENPSVFLATIVSIGRRLGTLRRRRLESRECRPNLQRRDRQHSSRISQDRLPVRPTSVRSKLHKHDNSNSTQAQTAPLPLATFAWHSDSIPAPRRLVAWPRILPGTFSVDSVLLSELAELGSRVGQEASIHCRSRYPRIRCHEHPIRN